MIVTCCGNNVHQRRQQSVWIEDDPEYDNIKVKPEILANKSQRQQSNAKPNQLKSNDNNKQSLKDAAKVNPNQKLIYTTQKHDSRCTYPLGECICCKEPSNNQSRFMTSNQFKLNGANKHNSQSKSSHNGKETSERSKNKSKSTIIPKFTDNGDAADSIQTNKQSKVKPVRNESCKKQNYRITNEMIKIMIIVNETKISVTIHIHLQLVHQQKHMDVHLEIHIKVRMRINDGAKDQHY